MPSPGRNEGIRVLDDFVTDAICTDQQQSPQIEKDSAGIERNINAIREAFIEQQRKVHATNGMTPDESELESEWHCSEEFTQLLIEVFHRAKIAALSEAHNRNIPEG